MDPIWAAGRYSHYNRMQRYAKPSPQYSRPSSSPAPVLKAKFNGTCRRCGGKIAAGDDICKDEHGVWGHNVCPASAPGQLPRQDKPADLVPGVYEVDGVIYVVKPGRQSKDHLYAKRLKVSPPRPTETGEQVDFDFEYEKGAIFKIRPEHRMPFERAKELIVKYGRCLYCGRFLKAAKSLERGIGPVCIKRLDPSKRELLTKDTFEVDVPDDKRTVTDQELNEFKIAPWQPRGQEKVIEHSDLRGDGVQVGDWPFSLRVFGSTWDFISMTKDNEGDVVFATYRNDKHEVLKVYND